MNDIRKYWPDWAGRYGGGGGEEWGSTHNVKGVGIHNVEEGGGGEEGG